MLSVVTLSGTSPETCSAAPEVVSHAADVATARADLLADLTLTAEPDYLEQVCEWFTSARECPGMIVNEDGTVDVWVFDAEEDHLAA